MSKYIHKLIPGTPFAVDCFRQTPKDVDILFLSHGHAGMRAWIEWLEVRQTS